jgi:two-component system, response regulator PdtaR
MDARQPFTGRRLLIVEDELLIALELQSIVEQLGGTVVGPAGSVEDALQFLSETTPNAALLDVTLRDGRVTPVAQACRDRSVPFALVTGYGRLELEEPLLQSAPRVRKPFDSRAIHKVLAIMLNTDRENPDFRTDTIVAARAGARRGTILGFV